MGFLAAIVTSFLATLLAEEFRTLLPWLIERTLRTAVRIAPAAQRARLHEEWAAHLDDTPGGYTKLCVAVGLIIAASKLAYRLPRFERLLSLSFGRRVDSKRLLDVPVSLLLIAFVLPLCLLIALAIYLDSPGPIFYSQKRISRYGQTLRIFKFRTMLIEAASEGYWVSWRDPPITRVGRVIRRYRLDELPQLINVLRGEMSFRLHVKRP